jgi:hypothetical protein
VRDEHEVAKKTIDSAVKRLDPDLTVRACACIRVRVRVRACAYMRVRVCVMRVCVHVHACACVRACMRMLASVSV